MQRNISVDVSFARPFMIGDAGLSIEGHIEYVGERTDELGDTLRISTRRSQSPVDIFARNLRRRAGAVWITSVEAFGYAPR